MELEVHLPPNVENAVLASCGTHVLNGMKITVTAEQVVNAILEHWASKQSIRDCKWCATPFNSRRKDAVYCSAVCRATQHRKKVK